MTMCSFFKTHMITEDDMFKILKYLFRKYAQTICLIAHWSRGILQVIFRHLECVNYRVIHIIRRCMCRFKIIKVSVTSQNY